MAHQWIGHHGDSLPPTIFEDSHVYDYGDFEGGKGTRLYSFVLVAIDLLVISAIPWISILVQRRRRREGRDDGVAARGRRKRLSPEQFLELFRENNVSMRLEEEHLDCGTAEENTEPQINNDNGTMTTRLKDGSENNVVVAPTTCAICLEAYRPGDTVVWSTNLQCKHVFHQDCIIFCFTLRDNKLPGNPCPCCRRQFCDTSTKVIDHGR